METPLTTGIFQINGPYPASPGAITNQLLVPWEAADVANGNSFPYTGKDTLMIQNSHATISYTYTLKSQPDDQKRTTDIGPITLAAGLIHIFDFTNGSIGWATNPGRLVLVAGSNAAIKFAVGKHG